MWVELDLAKLDVVFISYDEPEADENYAALCHARPDAQRVHGVKGFDEAHRAAGHTARSDHVITIDGDNRLRKPAFLKSVRFYTPRQLTCVISYAARVTHNDLVYGNGGLKIWPRHMLQSLRSHEKNRQSAPGIDFAWQVPYAMASGCPTETHVIATPQSAFRAGYREGVRLTMHCGRTATEAYPDLEPAEAMQCHLPDAVMARLRVWCFRAPDSVEGQSAMLGARLGCLEATGQNCNLSIIADFDAMASKWRDLVGEDGTGLQQLASLLSQTEKDLAALDVRAPNSVGGTMPRLGVLLPHSEGG